MASISIKISGDAREAIPTPVSAGRGFPGSSAMIGPYSTPDRTQTLTQVLYQSLLRHTRYRAVI
ncbi:hypothetical protein [Gynuella sunshinyii]|uniref:Uncharacterized protein n=1 Tax=Gynuella sunshinyii YC6258 TaxID=1445510 RepID=A0A0C5VFZ1_9GAMM|nr:hypothetical protein [Gynuella sunshinyii]AJQ93522.1 hypothetical Protein YC6258_01474 [Gynuella sunshinyii YC6258]